MKRPQEPPFGLRLPPDLKMWVKMKAKIEDRSMNNLLISLIRQAMEQTMPRLETRTAGQGGNPDTGQMNPRCGEGIRL